MGAEKAGGGGNTFRYFLFYSEIPLAINVCIHICY